MDLRTALRDLRSGLTRVGWIADGLIGRGGAQLRDGDAAGPIESRFENVTLEGSDFRARGGASIADIVEIFVENGMRHDRALPRILVREEGDGVRIVVDGAGEPMDASFRDQAFTIEGQDAIKGQRGGRYARFAGLVAARSYVEGLGGSLEASEHEGQARTIIHLPRP
ncbi:MAG: ATP-binding protein, partial [Myxococcota bacterium]